MAVEPRVFSEDDCAKIEVLASYMSINDIADYFGIGTETLANIRDRQPEVDIAYKRGAANAKTRSASKLFRYIDDPELNQTNLSATIFYLKTKGGWVDAGRLMEREITKVKQDLIDIKTVENPKELINKIDRAVANIDLIIRKEGYTAS